MAESSNGGAFGEHLRLIHFSLVVSCLALLIAATSYQERALDTAIDDIDRITGVFPVVADGQWLQRESDKVLSSRPVISPLRETWRLDIPISMLSSSIREITKDKPLTVKFEIAESNAYTLVRGVRPDLIRVGLLPDPLRQFDDWRRMWDEMQSVQICIPHIAEERAWFVSGTPGVLTTLSIMQWQESTAPAFFRTQRLELQSVWKELSQPLISNGSIAVVSKDVRYAFVGNAVERSVSTRITMGGQDLTSLLQRQDAIPTAMIPVTCEMFDLRAQSILADKAAKNWSPGSFDQTFPDLAALSDGLGALQPEQIGRVLRNLRERTGKEVEVSGLKLPLEVITRWGLVIIVGIQLYFWIELRSFAARPVTALELEFPWLGFYQDRISRIVFLMSAVLLPVATVSLLVIKGVLGVEGWQHRLVFGTLSSLMGLLSAFLSALTFGLIQSLWNLQARVTTKHDSNTSDAAQVPPIVPKE